ncbi:MAG: class I SAM-dependent methyltransferase [Bacteroidetes bacterium]|nr:class I SAM-dependent methyltransferase [Bacteroidota bacterium]
MFEFHKDKVRYFDMQYCTSKDYIIPFVSPHLNFQQSRQILEIGCAEAGVLKAFVDEGHICTGIELSDYRVGIAKSFLKKDIEDGKVQIINKNIFDIDVNIFDFKFDLIILKDVIEHLPNQQIFIRELKKLLKPNGFIFFGFPPWQMPFGGHQQICKGKIAAFLPYYHILPRSIYKGILKLFGERNDTIDELIDIKNCRISIEKFEKIAKSEGYEVVDRIHFFINPIYKFKFNLKIRKQTPIISNIPYFRNYLTTAVYYLIKQA